MQESGAGACGPVLMHEGVDSLTVTALRNNCVTIVCQQILMGDLQTVAAMHHTNGDPAGKKQIPDVMHQTPFHKSLFNSSTVM